MPKVVITLPAYRAAQTVAKTVADVPADLAEHMILVDDASPDDTVELARSLGLRVYVHTENRGYGANLKTCYLKALEGAADVVVVLHPDYQYDPKAVPLLIAPILAGDADMTFGSRFAGIGDPLSQGMPFYRFLGNRFTTVFQNAILGTRFTEMHSGMRAYTRECLLSLPFLGYSDDFVFESQILVDAVVRRYRVVEVPIPTRYTGESSSLNLRGLFKYVWETVLHTWRRTSRWGRRGRRWPAPARVSTAPATEPRTWATTTPPNPSVSEKVGAAIVESALDRLRHYLLPGTTVAVVAGDDEWLQQLTLTAGWQRSQNPEDRADAIVLISGANDPTALADAAAASLAGLQDEGMLALVMPSGAAAPPAVAAALDARGLRFIDWERAGGLASRWTVALARPKSQS
jgi:hypothetical protein